MKVHTLIYDKETFGITNKSLRMLRNAIADNLKDEILVIEIPTNDICCGFLVLNKTKESATWSGDGFRFDKGGEGGRGYLAAKKMMDVFGIKYFNLFSEQTIKLFKESLGIHYSDSLLAQALLQACNKAAEDFEDEEFKCSYETTPWY